MSDANKAPRLEDLLIGSKVMTRPYSNSPGSVAEVVALQHNGARIRFEDDGSLEFVANHEVAQLILLDR